MTQTVADIKRRLKAADAREFEVLERSLVADTRKGVREAIEVARRRLSHEAAEAARLKELYDFECALVHEHGARVVVGLDEVGRGPLAGPLCVGAVVLGDAPCIAGLNDSKQIPSHQREEIAATIKKTAQAWAVEFIQPADIDARGMSWSLKEAFSRAVASIEGQGVSAQMLLLDGNPLHLDEREVNVVKGDARCASIAAASIIAKVERDRLMCELSVDYPKYGFASNKGYASEAHIEAIKTYGLSPVHRASFCTAWTQPTLF